MKRSRRHTAQRVQAFLAEIGLEVVVEPGASGFVPGVVIRQGRLHVDEDRVEVGELLHEAGHVSVFPARFRHLADGDIGKAQKAMFRALRAEDADLHGLEWRHALQCCDPEATAWAWAAGLHLAIHPREIIAGKAYGGEGDDVRTSLQLRAYCGINGLFHAGMCVASRTLAASLNVEPFPAMSRWVQV